MVVLNTATWIRITATPRLRSSENSKALPSANEYSLWGKHAIISRKRKVSLHPAALAQQLPRVTFGVASATGAREFLHERHERIHTVLGKRVVQRRAHAAHRPVSLQPIQ